MESSTATQLAREGIQLAQTIGTTVENLEATKAELEQKNNKLVEENRVLYLDRNASIAKYEKCIEKRMSELTITIEQLQQMTTEDNQVLEANVHQKKIYSEMRSEIHNLDEMAKEFSEGYQNMIVGLKNELHKNETFLTQRYEAKIKDSENRISKLKATVTQLNHEKESLEIQKAELVDTNSELKTRITDLEKLLNEVLMKRSLTDRPETEIAYVKPNVK
ncbi:chromosome partition protein Smc-like [Anopheles coustani]|uniref:chromosome partition protein Smc-like n=1 Tax=Anopheles coustani TaxID=139045 RepID=UPI0026591644|nr:chromosome partition protein Smc-like [Anopheles coustani]